MNYRFFGELYDGYKVEQIVPCEDFWEAWERWESDCEVSWWDFEYPYED